MTLSEILKAKGIDDATVKGILDEMKTNKIFTAGEENLDIRYGKLKGEHDSKTAELAEAQKLIEELKKSTKGNEGLQKKISDYDAQVAQLQAELERTKIESAARVGLLSAGAVDVDYLLFKLMEKGDLSLDDNGHISGWDDKLAALKTQIPAQFASAQQKTVLENKLPDAGDPKPLTKSDILKMPYSERAKLAQENPEGYSAAMNNTK